MDNINKFPDYYFETYQFDWFLCDKEGNIACLSSAQSGVPHSVRTAIPNKYALLQDYMNALPIISKTVKPSEFIKEAIKDTKQYSDPSAYIAGFSFLTERGLYSYDRSYKESFANYYNLIVKPNITLNVKSLPLHLAKIVLKTKLDGFLSDVIHVSDID